MSLCKDLKILSKKKERTKSLLHFIPFRLNTESISLEILNGQALGNAVQIISYALLAILDIRLVHQGVLLEEFLQTTLSDTIEHLFGLTFLTG